MAAIVKKQSKTFDVAVWLFVAIFACGAIVANQVYDNISVVVRMLAVMTTVLLCLFMAYQTAAGKIAASFVSEARQELRKVVWPTRQETLQSTMMVFIMVVIMGIVLWTFDAICLRIVAWLTGYGA